MAATGGWHGAARGLSCHSSLGLGGSMQYPPEIIAADSVGCFSRRIRTTGYREGSRSSKHRLRGLSCFHEANRRDPGICLMLIAHFVRSFLTDF